MSNNQYGLDNDYFERKIATIHRDGLKNWRPDELARELARMSRTADKTVMQEPEFADASQLAALREELAERTNTIFAIRKKCRELVDADKEQSDIWFTARAIDLLIHSDFPDKKFTTLADIEVERLQQRLADAERRNELRDTEIAAQIESALRRSFNLGQVYWQQADSDSTRQQNKCDQTMETQAQHILNVLKSVDAALNPKTEAS